MNQLSGFNVHQGEEYKMTVLEYMNKLQVEVSHLRRLQEAADGAVEARLARLENKICELEKTILMLNGCGR